LGTGDEVAGVGALAAAWRTTSKLLAYLRRGTYTECTLARAGLLESILRRHLVVLGTSTVESYSQRLLHLGVDILL